METPITAVEENESLIKKIDGQLFLYLEKFASCLNEKASFVFGVLLGFRKQRITLRQFAIEMGQAHSFGRFRLVRLAGEVVRFMPFEPSFLAGLLITLPRSEWLAAFPQLASCFPEPEAALDMLDLLSGRLVFSDNEGDVVRHLAW